jgi:hypothetical protein
MDELRIPKHEVEAELTLENGEIRRGVLFLANAAADHTGAERVLDLLNGPADFIPLKTLDRPGVLLMSRAAILLVRTAPESSPDEELPEPAFHHGVEVTLRSGNTVKGALEYSQAPEHARILDYLSRAAQFFSIHQKEHVLHVNKQHVVHVVPLDG